MCRSALTKDEQKVWVWPHVKYKCSKILTENFEHILFFNILINNILKRKKVILHDNKHK